MFVCPYIYIYIYIYVYIYKKNNHILCVVYSWLNAILTLSWGLNFKKIEIEDHLRCAYALITNPII